MNDASMDEVGIDMPSRQFDPQPIAEVMAKVLAQYGLSKSPQPSERVAYYSRYSSAQPVAELAFA
jgi:hypothetical protein